MAERTYRFGRQEITVKETGLDRLIARFDPVRAQKRLAARAGLAMVGALAGGYTGGRRDKRSLSTFSPRGTSADAAILPDLATLRERSRDLVRNTPMAAGALDTAVTNVVGTGLMLKSRVNRAVLGWSEEQAAVWQANTEMEFSLWAESCYCDITCSQDFYGLQGLAFRSEFENGDSIALLPFVERRGFPYRLAVQLIEADRLSNKDGARDTPQLAGGVRLDSFGAPVAYQIQDQHPGDLMVVKRTWSEYAAFGGATGRRNVLHNFHRKRIGQTRGVPWFTPVVESFKQLDRYDEAEITAAVLSAMIAIVTKTADRGGLTPHDSAVSGSTPTGTDAPVSSWDGTLTPGLAVDLGLDEDVHAFKGDGRPNPQFDLFTQAFLRRIGVGLGLPFEVLVKHFTASYSAARAALLEAWRFYWTHRARLASGFCQPVYGAWMEEAVAIGRIQAPGFFDDALFRAAYLGSEWHGDGPGAIDPEKEVNAAKTRMEIHLTTLDEEIAGYSGGSVESKLEQAGREKKLKEKHGLGQAELEPKEPVAGKAREKENGSDREVHVHLPESMTHVLARDDSAILQGMRSVASSLTEVVKTVGDQALEAGRSQTAVVRDHAAAVQEALKASSESTVAAVGRVAHAAQATSKGLLEEMRQNSLAVTAGLREIARETGKPRKAKYDEQGNLIGSVPVDKL